MVIKDDSGLATLVLEQQFLTVRKENIHTVTENTIRFLEPNVLMLKRRKSFSVQHESVFD